ncbi:MAG: hypothetical protein AAF456_06795 [Planctomycetota bacterium]
MSNNTEPMLSDAIEGFVFQTTETCPEAELDRTTFEVACVDLISRLENCLARATEMEKDDFVDKSGKIGRQMAGPLKTFTRQFLTGKAAEQANAEISRAVSISHTYEEVLKTRPLTNAIIRTFFNVDEVEQVRESHERLGESLVRACAATFYHAIKMVGLDSELGREIDQSSVIFVNQLKDSWK